MGKHKEVAKIDESTLQEDFQDQVDISPTYGHCLLRLVAMLEEFQTIWDVHLKTINVAKNKTYFTPPNASPIHSVLY